MNNVEIYKKAEAQLKNAQGVFLNHQQRLATATGAVTAMLARIEANGMNDDFYSNSADLLKKIKVTVSKFKEERSEITQAANSIVKAFTSQENAIDITKPDTDVYKIKKYMDEYATMKEAEKQLREDEERRKADREREIRSVKISALSFLEKVCIKASNELKSDITALVNSISLENYDQIRAKLLSYDTRIPEGLFGSFGAEIVTVFIGDKEKQEIIDELKGLDDWKQMQDGFSKELGIFLQETLATLPSVKHELEEIAAADFNRAEEMKKEKLKREFEENKRIEEERLRAQKAAEEQEKERLRKAAIQAEFEFGSATVEVDSNIKVKNLYEVELIMPMGLLEVTQYWCSKQEWPMDTKKVMTVSFERMIKFAESEAAKNNDFIKSDYVKYKPIVQSKL